VRDYELRLQHAKTAVTNAVMRAVSKDPPPDAVMTLAGAIDDLNKAWDNLTDCLCRQRDFRDQEISRLMSELAEAKK
jgi:hypothetical protein